MGKKEKKDQGPPEPEVDKSFYEVQIFDLNRKLAQLKTLCTELENKHREWEERYAKLDEDRADAIAYLKQTLQKKQAEVSELQERLLAMQEALDAEVELYKAKLAAMEEEFKVMREQLTSEIKLITGKLNALEEFRIQRDELMKKFAEQERNIEEQEIRHKQSLYDTEKKFILGKDSVKKEMEKRLLGLADDFQKANNLRIASTTNRVLTENIQFNKNLDKLISAIEHLESDNEQLKVTNKQYRLKDNLFTTERNKACGDAQAQLDAIHGLIADHKKITQTLEDNKIVIKKYQKKGQELVEALNRESDLLLKVKILEQNLQVTRCQELSIQSDLKDTYANAARLKGILNEGILAIESVLEMQEEEEMDESMKVARRETLINNLLTLMSQGVSITADPTLAVSPSGSIPPLAATYARGDLGFIPKFKSLKRPRIAKIDEQSQLGASFEDFARLQALLDAEATLHALTEQEYESEESLSSPFESVTEIRKEESLKLQPSKVSSESTKASLSSEEKVMEESSKYEGADSGEYEVEYEYDYERELEAIYEDYGIEAMTEQTVEPIETQATSEAAETPATTEAPLESPTTVEPEETATIATESEPPASSEPVTEDEKQ